MKHVGGEGLVLKSSAGGNDHSLLGEEEKAEYIVIRMVFFFLLILYWFIKIRVNFQRTSKFSSNQFDCPNCANVVAAAIYYLYCIMPRAPHWNLAPSVLHTILTLATDRPCPKTAYNLSRQDRLWEENQRLKKWSDLYKVTQQMGDRTGTELRSQPESQASSLSTELLYFMDFVLLHWSLQSHIDFSGF